MNVASGPPGVDGTPNWAYGEDGYCVCCGNGRWKHHMPECDLRDSLDIVKMVRRMGLMVDGPTLILHAGPYSLPSGHGTPYAARIFHGSESAYVDNEAAHRAITEIEDLLDRMADEDDDP